MLQDRPILIVEDNVYLALDLTTAVEQFSGRVVGPVGRVADALEILDQDQVAAAIVDYELPGEDVRPLITALDEKRVPYVIHASNAFALEIGLIEPRAPILTKPIQPLDVVTILAYELAKTEIT